MQNREIATEDTIINLISTVVKHKLNLGCGISHNQLLFSLLMFQNWTSEMNFSTYGMICKMMKLGLIFIYWLVMYVERRLAKFKVSSNCISSVPMMQIMFQIISGKIAPILTHIFALINMINVKRYVFVH